LFLIVLKKLYNSIQS